MKIKGPILKVNLTHYACGDSTLYVSRVTDKIIVCVCNEMCETYYRRVDGLPRSRERSGLASIGIPRITNLEALESWLRENGIFQNGTYIYDSGFRLAYNSKGHLVKPLVKEAWERACKDYKGRPTFNMLKELGYKFVDLC